VWMRVAKLAEIPDGGSKVVSIKGANVAIFRVKDAVYAVDNVCPHRGGPLAEGHVEAGRVTCPWHAWEIDLSSGACEQLPGERQPVFPAKIEGEDVLVDA
jgi:nitrite reductase (NADH) small subunit